MDYKKKYTDLIERLRKAMDDDSVNDDRYCCVIKDIVPELAEPDDERIRKAIVDVFKTHCDYEVYFGVSVTDILAWLKKKGEHKPIPIDYNKAFDDFLSHIPEKDPESSNSLYTYEDLVSAIQFGVRWQKEQKPAEWNTEDIFTLDFLVDYLSRIIVNASPEEYIDGLARAVTLLKAIKDGIIPRPHWKPSEEQMKALRAARSIDGVNHVVFASLIYDLEKLMK